MSYQTADSTAPTRLGRYELIGQLATGGMAEIHLARLAGEAGFEKIVVLKRLLPELVASKAFVAMFLDEGKLVARLDHPNICEVYELGRDGNEYFLAMPFLDGVPVADLIARARDPDRIAQLRIAAGVIVQACAGLHHAHDLRGADGAPLGLVHRDVSPSNLFVTTSGVIKVLDFGVAKFRGAAETEAGTIKGKTQYMAPEQILGEPLDRRCDVFALGIVLYELATHQRLFKRASDYLAARAILEDPIPRADAADPAIPSALADVIARALARRREDRFGDAGELAGAIEQAMANHGGVATAPQISSALSEWHADELTAQRTRQLRVLDDARSRTTPSAVERSSSDVATIARSPKRSRRTWIAAGIATAVVAATAVTFGVTRRTSDDGSTVHGLEIRGSDPRGSAIADNRGSDGRGSDIVGSDNAGSDSAGSDSRGSAVVAHVRDADPHAHARGTFSIDSKPFATIFVDDKPLGVTPLVHRALAAGRHRVRAVLQDGRQRELWITVPAGKAAQPLTLTW